MLLKDRRIILGIGAALLVGGWGFADFGSDVITRSGGDTLDQVGLAIIFYAPGVVTMAIGAGLIGVAALRKSE